MPDTDTMPAEGADTSTAQSAEPANAASPAPGAASADSTVQGDSTAPAAPNAQEAQASLPTPQQTDTEPAQPQAKPVDWEKRYRDQQSYMDRTVNQWQQRMQAQQAQMAELAKWKQEQEQRANAAKLKPWSKAHPEYQKFNGVLERAKVVEQQLRRIPATLPPEQQEAMKQAILGALSPEDQQQISEYRDSLQNFQRDFFTDPHGTLLPMVEQLAEQKVQSALQKIEAQQSVMRDFQDPAMKPMVEKYRDDFAKALNDGVPYEYAKHMMGMFAELESLRNQTKSMAGKAAQADEQRRLAKGEAEITRDPRTPARDPYELAKAEAQKRGIGTGSKQFLDLLTKYTKG